MLKEELEEEIIKLEEKLEKETKAHQLTDARLKAMLERVDEYDRLIVIRDDALTAIDAIKSVNCTAEDHWSRYGHEIIAEAERNGSEKPERPEPSKLYS